MFSKRAIDEANDIDNGIEYLFNFFQGNIVSWERSGGLITDEDVYYGDKIEELKSFFYVDTDKQKYIVSIRIHSRYKKSG